jgi:kanosamine-6-phosphate phosphatase
MVTDKIKSPKYIIFSDFDETYLAHNQTELLKKYLELLEKYLIEFTKKYKILFG